MTVLKKALVKSYDAAEHKATVQIAGSLGVWLESLRVATSIPPADVVAGRQCTVLFLDPSNQDDAVVITVHGELPSVGQILVGRATADLTLTTAWQPIPGDGNNGKVRILLPTPGDWLIAAACDLAQNGASSPGPMSAALFVNDSGSPQPGEAVLTPTANGQRATVTQRWKVTITAADTPIELKAKMTTAGGSGVLRDGHTALSATGVQRSAQAEGVTDHGDLTGLADDDHPQYGALAQAETWTALQTFGAGIKLPSNQAICDAGGNPRLTLSLSIPNLKALGTMEVTGLLTASGGIKLPAGQAIKDSEAVDRLLLRVASVYQTGDVQQIVGNLRLGVAGWGAIIQGIDGINRIFLTPNDSSPHVKLFGDLSIEATYGLTAFTLKADSPRLTWDHTGSNPRRLEMLADATDFSIFNRTDGNYILRHMLASQVNWIPAPTLIGAEADPATSAVLELSSTTGALLLSRLTTAQRDALTPVDGMVIYNTTTGQFEGRAGGAWVAL